jgi:purine-nucleoside phosphorylase
MRNRVSARRRASADETPPVAAAVDAIRTASNNQPRLAIVLGSGFGGVLEAVDAEAAIPYAAIPGFPATTVQGHAGRLVVGRLGRTPVYLLAGRAHFYEGHDLEVVTFPVRVLAALGVADLLLTNAAGAINPRFHPGDFMLVTDHINLMGANPLRGPVQGAEPRFVDLSRVYDPGLARRLAAAARVAGARLRRGVYLAVSGPSYETPAEVRAFARLGADAVGMSTVPEAIVARACGLRVAGLSCLTNLAAGLGRTPISHTEVLTTAAAARERAVALLTAFAS